MTNQHHRVARPATSLRTSCCRRSFRISTALREGTDRCISGLRRAFAAPMSATQGEWRVCP